MGLRLTESGFLLDQADWNEQVANDLASCHGIRLTVAHWEILEFLRTYYQSYNHLPNARMFVKALQKGLGAEKGNSIYLHELFPDAPLRFACLIAGLPKPPGCI